MRQPRDLRKPSRIRLAAAGAASLIGAAYCAASGLGGLDEICLTSGCALYKNVRLAGLSLWWWGALAFLFLGGVSFIGKGGLALWAAVLFVGADLFFLGWLALTTPCISCLGAACFFALVLFILRPSQGAGAKISLIALLVWLFLLSPNLFMSLKEIQGPWPVHGRPDSPVSVYFSPSCPVCLDTIYSMAEKKIDAAFYPVGEAPGDEDMLRAMMQRLEQGQSLEQAIESFWEEARVPPKDRFSALRLKWRLFRNKMRLGLLGAHKVPVVVTFGQVKAAEKQPLSESFLEGKQEFKGCEQGVDCP